MLKYAPGLCNWTLAAFYGVVLLISGLHAQAPSTFESRTAQPNLALDRSLGQSTALIAVGNVLHFAGSGLWIAGYSAQVRDFFSTSTLDRRVQVVSPLRLVGGGLMASGPLMSSIGSAAVQRRAVAVSKDPYTRLHFLDFGKGALFVALSNLFGIAGTAMAISSNEPSVLYVSAGCSLALAAAGEIFWIRSATEPAGYVRTMKTRMVKGELQFSLAPLPADGGGGLQLSCRF